MGEGGGANKFSQRSRKRAEIVKWLKELDFTSSSVTAILVLKATGQQPHQYVFINKEKKRRSGEDHVISS